MGKVELEGVIYGCNERPMSWEGRGGIGRWIGSLYGEARVETEGIMGRQNGSDGMGGAEGDYGE